jgi:hypothetical protein
MKSRFRIAICLVFLIAPALGASKPHVIVFGKWTVVKSSADLDRDRLEDLKVRPLYVDTRLKEFTFGIPHEITEQVFVVRRVVRVNDTLPQETTVRWSWQRGGWLVVDRLTGHVSQASLPEFDPDFSSASWYRDYVAYCGISDDGSKLSAVVMQLGRRKPILKKPLGEAPNDEKSSEECSPPAWQRAPTRVSFVSQADQKFTFAVRGRSVEVVTDDDPEEGTQ